MPLPYKIATLLYCFNERDEVLLLERAQEPNLGYWSPCGGKLHTDIGESPYACACREAEEELGVKLSASDLHLAGLVSEHGYLGQSHWLMFLFEVKKKGVALNKILAISGSGQQHGSVYLNAKGGDPRLEPEKSTEAFSRCGAGSPARV